MILVKFLVKLLIIIVVLTKVGVSGKHCCLFRVVSLWIDTKNPASFFANHGHNCRIRAFCNGQTCCSEQDKQTYNMKLAQNSTMSCSAIDRLHRRPRRRYGGGTAWVACWVVGGGASVGDGNSVFGDGVNRSRRGANLFRVGRVWNCWRFDKHDCSSNYNTNNVIDTRQRCCDACASRGRSSLIVVR